MKKAKTKSETRYKVQVFAYVDAQPMHPVPMDRTWYWERKILFTGNENGLPFVVGYENGFKVKWSVKMYQFHNVRKYRIKELISYMNDHPQKYTGWLHHMNLYGGVTGKFKEQIKIE